MPIPYEKRKAYFRAYHRRRKEEAAKAKDAHPEQAGPASPSPDREARAEIERLRDENDRLRKQLDDVRKAEPELIAKLRDRVGHLEAVIAYGEASRAAAAKAQRTKAAKLKAEAEALGIDDPRIVELQKKNSDLRKEMSRMKRLFDEKARRSGIMSKETRHKIMRCLHSDTARNMTAKQRDEACALFIEWMQNVDKVGRW